MRKTTFCVTFAEFKMFVVRTKVQYGSVKIDLPGAPLKKGGTRTYSCVPRIKGDLGGSRPE